jgi:hypothetical protein
MPSLAQSFPAYLSSLPKHLIFGKLVSTSLPNDVDKVELLIIRN